MSAYTHRRKIIFLAYLHLAALYGLFLNYSISSLVFGAVLLFLGQIGMTVGAHRCFSHRSFEVTEKLKYVLVMMQTLVPIGPIYEYVEMHRIHHKFHGTDADPFNSKRGFLFSHIGWLTSSKPHSAFDDEMKKMEFNDIKYDQLLKFQSKNYFNLVALVSFMFPLCVNVYILGASPFVAWHWNMLRILIALHWSLVLNSMGSYFGSKPYDKGIAPRDSQALSLLTLGEGFRNYHYVYPWDYKASDSVPYPLNISSLVIDFLAFVKLAMKLKETPREISEKQAIEEGDGSHSFVKAFRKIMIAQSSMKSDKVEAKRRSNIWGSYDRDIKAEDMKLIKILQ